MNRRIGIMSAATMAMLLAEQTRNDPTAIAIEVDPLGCLDIDARPMRQRERVVRPATKDRSKAKAARKARKRNRG